MQHLWGKLGERTETGPVISQYVLTSQQPEASCCSPLQTVNVLLCETSKRQSVPTKDVGAVIVAALDMVTADSFHHVGRHFLLQTLGEAVVQEEELSLRKQAAEQKVDAVAL